MIAVSSCLIGKKCRYNATDSLSQQLLEELVNYIDICPEVLGGLSTPRLPCEIVYGTANDVLNGNAKIRDSSGNDITSKMINGTMQALNICKDNDVTKAYLKQNSPTCGCGRIYDGSFSGKLKKGNGIFAELLLSNGIDVVAV